MTRKTRTALVTGASRGIGRAIAQRLGRDGALVAVHYGRNAEAAAEAVRVIEAAGGRAFAIQADLAVPDEIRRLFDKLDAELRERTGDNGLDILVNNAAAPGFGGIEATSLEEFDLQFAVDVRAPFLVTQAALQRLRGGGRIINISSGLAVRPSPRAAVYSMAKASINAFTVLLAMQLGPRRITVNAVGPGWTATDMNAEARRNPELVRQVEAATALGRFGEPADIAAVVGFLASEDAGWVTGQYIEASGGFGLVDGLR